MSVQKRDDAKIERESRILVWGDDFNGTGLDPEKWCFLHSMNHTGMIYDNGLRHARVEDGKLHLQVHKAGDTWSLCDGVTTKTTMAFRYGYLELRACPPFRRAAWPSFWLLCNTPLHDDGLAWSAEIDIYEIFSSESRLSPNLHKWGSAGHEMLPGAENNRARAYSFEHPENLNREYHIYGFAWDPHSMKFYVDGEMYYETVIDAGSSFVSERYPDTRGFHEPAYILFNNEVFTPQEGSWIPKERQIDPSVEMPIDYYIDYVRLYQKPGEEIFDAKTLADAEEARSKRIAAQKAAEQNT